MPPTPTSTKSTPARASAERAERKPLATADTPGLPHLAREEETLPHGAEHPGLVRPWSVLRPALEHPGEAAEGRLHRALHILGRAGVIVVEACSRRRRRPFLSARRRGMVPPMSNLFSIDGKVALVTGGSRGIGLMIARGFVEAGAKVYISSRKAEVCDQVAAELSRQGTCGSLPADCSTEAGARGLAHALAPREPALHVPGNNAGANWGAPLAEYPDAAWDKVLALNVKGVFHLTRACLPLLERAAQPGDPARVINICSTDGLHVPVLETYAYSASKAAVHHLTRVLAHRLAAQNITVNAIAPGPFESKMMHETLERFRDAIVASCPLGRIGEPEDMAGAAIYLASRAGAYLTGAVIPVDGGITTRHA